ncbi:putative carboxylesterase [Hypoxylon argillaceum]|nr:putative carboxylesterase [Hypoxylon argillaceum]
MHALLAALRYFRLKILVWSIRLMVRLLTPPVHAKPDAVLRVPSRGAGRTIKTHVYTQPAAADTIGSTEAQRTPRPVLINCFGSGFALPLFGADDFFCREISRRTGHVVLDVDYRLGPENPFPAAIHDVEDVVRYVLSHPETYDVDRISLSGFSSGGTLALVAPALFPAGTFRSLIAFYPSVEMVKDPGQRKAPVDSPDSGRAPSFLTQLFREGYIGDMDPRDPRISPLYGNNTNRPRDTLIITAEYDVSALEAEEYAKNAKEDVQGTGRQVVLRRMRGCGHNFDKSKKHVAARTEAYDVAVELLNQFFSNR